MRNFLVATGIVLVSLGVYWYLSRSPDAKVVGLTRGHRWGMLASAAIFSVVAVVSLFRAIF